MLPHACCRLLPRLCSAQEPFAGGPKVNEEIPSARLIVSFVENIYFLGSDPAFKSQPLEKTGHESWFWRQGSGVPVSSLTACGRTWFGSSPGLELVQRPLAPGRAVLSWPLLVKSVSLSRLSVHIQLARLPPCAWGWDLLVAGPRPTGQKETIFQR